MHPRHGPSNLPRPFAAAAVLLLAAAGPAAATAGPEPPPAVAATAAAVPADRADPRTGTATMAVPAIGISDLRVVPYEGTTDDRPGTRIQDRGVAASPYGERGGVGPGEKGNYLVTAHRIKAGGVLRDLPSLDEGDSVFVTADGRVYEYRITETRTTSFRSERSLAEQRAEVPGSPGEKPTQAMITVSTCATPEDDAAGNHWRDGNDNPEHRIDKIGVLVGSEPSQDARRPTAQASSGRSSHRDVPGSTT
ncbi:MULTISPECIES: class E sortase [Streptomyces]|uniref:Class E sortase n=2 Tax=Streptomyces TaxID=1883 RepID=A0ABU2RFU5_9ACTN|nr:MULTISPECIES: class E sortase [unclassified Streptomyces]MDT0427733.1 class E sortase [Streptomyces sp. DSM 41770]